MPYCAPWRSWSGIGPLLSCVHNPWLVALFCLRRLHRLPSSALRLYRLPPYAFTVFRVSDKEEIDVTLRIQADLESLLLEGDASTGDRVKASGTGAVGKAVLGVSGAGGPAAATKKDAPFARITQACEDRDADGARKIWQAMPKSQGPETDWTLGSSLVIDALVREEKLTEAHEVCFGLGSL